MAPGEYRNEAESLSNGSIPRHPPAFLLASPLTQYEWRLSAIAVVSSTETPLKRERPTCTPRETIAPFRVPGARARRMQRAQGFIAELGEKTC